MGGFPYEMSVRALPNAWLTLFQKANQHEEDIAHMMKVALDLHRQVEVARKHTTLSCSRITPAAALLLYLDPQLRIKWCRRGSCTCAQLRGLRVEGYFPSTHWLYVDRWPDPPVLGCIPAGLARVARQRMILPATRPRSRLRTMRAQPVLPAALVVTKRPPPTCSHL